MTFIFNENIIAIQDLEDNKDFYAGTLSRSFAEDSSSKILIDRIVDEGYGLRLVIVGDTSGEQCDILITNQELKDALSTTAEDIEEDQLALGVMNSKHQLPQQRGEVTLEDIVLSNDTVIFIYNAPDEMMKPAVLKSNDTLTNVINEEFEFSTCNYFEKKLFNDIADKGLKATFRFEYNKKKKHKDVTLSAQDVAQHIVTVGKAHDKELEAYVSIMKLGMTEEQNASIDIEDDRIIITLNVDEDMISLLYIQADENNDVYINDDMVKQTILSNKSLQFIFKAIAASNRHLVYRYINSNSDKSVKCVVKNLTLVKAMME